MVTYSGVLLAGGQGTRLYPASRSHRPKQFSSFGGDRSLLRRAADRATFLDELYAVTRSRYADQVKEIVPEATVLTEPMARDTGPALVYAAHEIREREADPVLLCLPSDHVIGEGFEADVTHALSVAEQTGDLLTLGIEPTRPAPEYGYIQPGRFEDGFADVESFHEKPDCDTAAEYVEQGYLWNAGIFAWRPDSLLRAAAETPLARLIDALDSGDLDRGFETTQAVSIDDAVLETVDSVSVVPASFRWDDLGSWDAVRRLLEGENAVLGSATTIDAANNVIASDEKHVSVIGVEDLVVAAFDDRVLVVSADDSQRVRDLVSILREEDAF